MGIQGKNYHINGANSEKIRADYHILLFTCKNLKGSNNARDC